MRRIAHLPILLLIATLLLASCGRQAPEPIPTATSEATATAAPSVAPTSTPEPTASPVPTASPAPAAELTPPELVAAAINQSIASEELSVYLEQVFQPASGIEQFWRVDANYNNAGELVEITGDIAIIAGTSQDTLLSSRINSQLYLSGPVRALGMDKPEWYKVDGDIGPLSFPRSEFAALLKQVAEPQVLATLEFEANTEHNGQACAMYAASAEAGTVALTSLVDNFGFPLSPHMPVQGADLSYEICDGQLGSVAFAAVVSENGDLAAAREVSITMLVAQETGNDIPDGVQAGTTVYVSPDMVAGLFDELAALASPPAPLYSATVFNGGNLRSAPNLNGDVLDQIHAAETVTLHGKSDNGNWYQISNPRGATGWVSGTLLTIDPAVAAEVPVGDHAPAAAVVPTQQPAAPAAPAEEPVEEPAAEPVESTANVPPFIPNTPVEFAMVKTALARSFQMEMEVSATGLPPEMLNMPDLDPAQPITVMRMTGKVDTNSEKAHITMSGLVTELMGGNADRGIEIITADGHSYLRGPMPMLGAFENRWYDLGPDSGTIDESYDDPDVLMHELQGQGFDLDIFTKTNSDTLDGQTCDVYSIDKAELMDLLARLDESGSMSPQDFADIDDMGVKIWICEDGYFHQFEVRIDATDPSMPDQPISIRVVLHIFDYNGNFSITPPSDALPLEMDPNSLFG